MKKIITILFVLIICVCISINLLSAMNLSFFGIRIFRIGSGSMEPYLRVNDLILIGPSNEYNVNDVITFKDDNNTYITHRIIEINGDKIITKGDNNNTKDGSITKDVVVGKLIYKFGFSAFLTYLFLKPTTWFLIFLVGAYTIIIMPTKKEKGKHAK